jgi:MFS family permease
MLVISLLIMGVATFLVGLVPGYAAIGIAAPIILVTLRFAQGIGLGGEWGGAVLMAAEHAPRGRRGFYASWPQIGAPVGFLLSSTVFLLFTVTLTEEQFASWGWRMPFLLSIVLVAAGLYIRLRIAETPAFRRVAESRSEVRLPVVEVLRRYPKNVALGTGLVLSLGAPFFIYAAFSLSYGTQQVGVAQSTMLYSVMIGSVFMGIVTPIVALLSDKVGRRVLCLAGVLLLGVWAFPSFWLIDTGRMLPITLAVTGGMVAVAVAYGPMAAFLSELFGTRVRYSGAGVSYMLGGLLGSAIAPMISTQLLASTGASWSISLYIVATSVIGLVSTLLLGETYQTDIMEADATGSRAEELGRSAGSSQHRPAVE